MFRKILAVVFGRKIANDDFGKASFGLEVQKDLIIPCIEAARARIL